jgi:hypothetical protein
MTQRGTTGPPRQVAQSPAPGQPSGRRISPGVVILVVALIGSVAYLLYAITVRDPSQIPLLASGAVVLGLVFAALAGYSLRATWRAGIAERNGRAVALGMVGGVAAMVSAGCFALAIIGFMLRPA